MVSLQKMKNRLSATRLEPSDKASQAESVSKPPRGPAPPVGIKKVSTSQPTTIPKKTNTNPSNPASSKPIPKVNNNSFENDRINKRIYYSTWCKLLDPTRPLVHHVRLANLVESMKKNVKTKQSCVLNQPPKVRNVWNIKEVQVSGAIDKTHVGDLPAGSKAPPVAKFPRGLINESVLAIQNRVREQRLSVYFDQIHLSLNLSKWGPEQSVVFNVAAQRRAEFNETQVRQLLDAADTRIRELIQQNKLKPHRSSATERNDKQPGDGKTTPQKTKPCKFKYGPRERYYRFRARQERVVLRPNAKSTLHSHLILDSDLENIETVVQGLQSNDTLNIARVPTDSESIYDFRNIDTTIDGEAVPALPSPESITNEPTKQLVNKNNLIPESVPVFSSTETVIVPEPHCELGKVYTDSDKIHI